ncbi:serine acetyltransferase [Bacteroides intestinalis]|mgnify:FL=1|uniref:Serine acetyltransferase n=2 Tax=Bacteroides intestinalis TaxID=329854 RepID=A0A412Y0E5_9BACE|nr:serine acetyltransferase [Bacteroides intestinalis]RHA57093.1 serine acetyltransferase [Bacteroides intestinalis]
MIFTRHDLKCYLSMDKYALGIKRRKPRFIGDDVWKFEITLRYHEYYFNNRDKSFVHKLLLCWYKYRHYCIGRRLGFDIPINVFDGGLRINHTGLIVVNSNARIGKYCDVHQGVNIGMQGKSEDDCPIIGDNVWIGPGAKLFGKIKIGSNCQIGANAVVNRSFEDIGITIAGIPARKVSDHANPYRREYLL